MRKHRLLIMSTILTIILITLVSVPTYATTEFLINQQTIDMQINDNGTVDVKESIVVETNGDSLKYTRELPSIVALDLNSDGDKENYEYQYKGVKVDGLESTLYSVGNDLVVEVTLDETKTINLEYTIILPKMKTEDQSYFFYSPFSIEQDYMIENLSVNIRFPKSLANPMDVSLLDLNEEKQSEYFEFSQEDTLLTIKNTQAVPSHSLLKIQGILGTDYFHYKAVPNYQLYSIIVSIIFIIAVSYYIFFFRISRSNRNKNMFYPPKDIPVPYYGYILDKDILSQDLFAQILVWANEGHIDIVQKKNDIFINVVRPLVNAPDYEEELFHLLFLEGTSVRLQDLESRNMEHDMNNICSSMMLHALSSIKKPVYVNTSKHFHMIYTILSSIPMALLAAATAFAVTGRMSEVIRFILITIVIIICSVFPLHFIVKRKEAVSRGSNSILSVLIVFWIVILWSALIIFLVQSGANTVYLTIVGILSIGFIFALLYATKRTKYGKIKYHDLSYLKHFMGFVQKPHLVKLLKDDENYFFELLPASYIYGNVQSWYKKFQTIRMMQPDWFYTDVTNKPWLQQLEVVLHELYFAITHDSDSD